MADLRLQGHILKLMEGVRKVIEDKDAVASGKMRDFTYDIHTDMYSLRVTINMPYYYKFVNEGVNGLDKNQGSPYSFRKYSTPRVMVDAIEKWIKIKGILPRSRKTGRFIKHRDGAYAIAHGLKKNGIKPRRFVSAIYNENFGTINEIRRQIAKGICNDIWSEIKGK